ncbi:MAG TPA: hypothetical protein VHY76_12500, partial [Acetobacteraceae bacterium]|nr:hypothetical protein [Acetobacteraceae bacterium]
MNAPPTSWNRGDAAAAAPSTQRPAADDRRFPVSDHCDGHSFFNPGPRVPARGPLQVLRLRFDRGRAVWPRNVANPAFPPPPATVAPGTVAISFINHSSFLIRLPGAVVLTDPIFSRR